MERFTCFINNGEIRKSLSTNDYCEAWALYREALDNYPNANICLIDNDFNEVFEANF